jgi:5'-nucleotidase/UDP-sugar diphosphatase
VNEKKTFWILMTVTAFFLSGFGCDEGNGKEDVTDGEEEGEIDGIDGQDDVPVDDGTEPDAEVDQEEDTVEEDAVEEDVPPPPPARVIILHTNDEHSQLLADGPMVDDYPLAEAAGDGSLKGGIYRRAVVLAREKAAAAEDGLPVMIFSGGDFSMGTLFQLGSVLQGVDFKLMTLLGYTATTIGNHEFDFGASTLATMLNNGGLLGGPVEIPVISSNIHFTSSTSDDALEDLYSYDGTGTMFAGYNVRTLPDGTTVGIIGFTGLDAAFVAPFKSPVYFSFTFTDQTCTASYECADGGSCVDGTCTAAPIQDHAAHMPALVADVAEAVRAVRAQDVDLVVALSHAGVQETEVAEILDGSLDILDAAQSEELIVAREVMRTLDGESLRGIDVIVGGHSHTALAAPLVVPDPLGGDQATIVVQSGDLGKNVGRLEIFQDADGLWQVEADGSHLVPVDDTIPGSELTPVTKGLIDQVVVGTMEGLEAEMLDDALNAFNTGTPIVDDTGVVGDLFFYPVAESTYEVQGEAAHRESMIVRMCADSARAMLNRVLYTADPVVAYVMANGAVRGGVRPSRADGRLSLADVYAVLSLGVSPVEETPGYPVIDMYLAVAELKAGLEIGISMGFEASSFFLNYSGVKIEYDPNLPAFDPENPTTTGRITKMTLWDPAADAALLPWDDNYSNVVFDITVTPDPFSGHAYDFIHVATNLYIGLFIEGFGLCPRNSAGQWDPLCGTCANTDADCADGLGNTATCINDAISPGVGKCVSASIPSVIKYITHFPGPGPEVKEWLTLVGFLQNLPDSTADGVPDLPAVYDADNPAVTFPGRVCCVQSPLSPADPCCHAEPCPTNYVACD